MKVIDVLYKIAQEDNICIDTNEFYRKITSNITYKELVEGLNSEIEIIKYTPKEDKKIEKIEPYIDRGNNRYFYTKTGIKCYATNGDIVMIDKINEIIDKVNNYE